MIRGIGIDIVELDRIKNSINQNERIIKRILTEQERSFFEQIVSDRRKIEYLAGRFAAKEAFAKALGTGLGKLSFQDIQIETDASGAPVLISAQSAGSKVFVSISHSQAYAVAQVVIEE